MHIRNDFFWTENTDSHKIRTKEILKKYPQVRELIGHNINLFYSTIILVSIQLAAGLFAEKLNLFLIIIASYFIGSTITHALFLGIHEITHNLAFKKHSYNNWLALFANLPIIFPYAMTFKVYHQLHHSYQGKDKIDVDIPTKFETKIFRGIIGKSIWLVNQILFYALRPVFVHPLKIQKWQVINILFQLCCMVIYFYFAGLYGALYLLLSIYFSGGLNPVSGHFISEHYVFKEGQETYSYYGILNKVTYNVGYHNEHHDFPSIPGKRLPELKKIAPEFYDTLKSYKSWVGVMLKFITDKNITLYSRIKRSV
jgi:sphingolipid delta-4 desaturase